MMANRRGVFYVLIFGLLTAGLCGCDRKLSSLDPFATPVVEDHGIHHSRGTDQIPSRNLAKKASQTTDPGQRESICQELAQQIRKEPDSIIRGEILRTLAAYGGRTADAVLRAGREGYRYRRAGYRLRTLGQAAPTPRPRRCWPACSPATATATSAWRPPAAWATSHDPAAVRPLGTALDDTGPRHAYTRNGRPAASRRARTLAPTPATSIIGGST